MLTRSSSWVDGVEKKKRDTRVVVLSNDAAGVNVRVCHATGPRSLGEGVLLLDIATINYFFCFHVAISRGIIGDERIAVESDNIRFLLTHHDPR